MKKPQPMFCVSVKPCLHSDTPILVSFLGSRGCQKSKLGAIWNSSRGKGLPCLGHQIMGHEGSV